jgi:hypothetical protein
MRSVAVCAWDGRGIRQWKLFAFFFKHLHFSKSDIAFMCFNEKLSPSGKYILSSAPERSSISQASPEMQKRLKCLDKIDTRRFKMSI